ncbi:YdeI/OmpD-associated family protein [Candidatus Bipolaricaulota bacterium]
MLQKQYIFWIATAKRTETRQRRTREAIERLERGERLGLK